MTARIGRMSCKIERQFLPPDACSIKKRKCKAFQKNLEKTFIHKLFFIIIFFLVIMRSWSNWLVRRL